MPRSSAIVAAGFASGTCLMAAQAFVTPAAQPPASSASLASSTASAAPLTGMGNSERAGSSTMAVLGVAGALAVGASAHRRTTGPRTSRRAKSEVSPEAPTLEEWIESGGAGFEASGFNPAAQVGVTAPLGFFDPLGFCKDGDAETFRKLRTAEIKHGRVAMMGSVGACVQHYVKFPGFEKVPSGISAVTEGPGAFGAIALLMAAGALEMGIWTESPDKEPGNFGDPMGMSNVGKNYCSNYQEMCNRELNNGRFCMFAVMGIIVAELVTGKDAIQQFKF